MTKISELLAAGPTYSVEFMPPRSDEMLRQLEKTLRELEPVAPSFGSVTYGAGGSTRDRTFEAVLHVHHDTAIPAMPHLTCVGQTRAEIDGLVRSYANEGIENLLALAGDPPKDGAVAGDFKFAVELIALARDVADFSIGVAAFPEVHPNSPDRDEDRRRLAEKLKLADFAITQFFWSAEHYFRLVDDMAALHCDTPIIPSVFLMLNGAAAERYTRVNGAEWPPWLAARVEHAGGDAAELQRIGVDVGTSIGQQLLDAGVPGLHLYTLNRSASTLEVWHNLGLSARR